MATLPFQAAPNWLLMLLWQLFSQLQPIIIRGAGLNGSVAAHSTLTCCSELYILYWGCWFFAFYHLSSAKWYGVLSYKVLSITLATAPQHLSFSCSVWSQCFVVGRYLSWYCPLVYLVGWRAGFWKSVVCIWCVLTIIVMRPWFRMFCCIVLFNSILFSSVTMLEFIV